MIIQNPFIRQGVADLAGALSGDPEGRARTVAVLANAQNNAAQRDLRFQEQDQRAGIAAALSQANPDLQRALALGAAQDFANIAENTSAAASLPGVADAFTPEQLSRFQTGAGVQSFGNTETGFGQGLENELARQRIASGATIRAAEIAAAQRAGSSARRPVTLAPGAVLVDPNQINPETGLAQVLARGDGGSQAPRAHEIIGRDDLVLAVPMMNAALANKGLTPNDGQAVQLSSTALARATEIRAADPSVPKDRAIALAVAEIANQAEAGSSFFGLFESGVTIPQGTTAPTASAPRAPSAGVTPGGNQFRVIN